MLGEFSFHKKLLNLKMRKNNFEIVIFQRALKKKKKYENYLQFKG